MTELYIDRRRLLKLGISAGVLGSLPLACLRVGDDELAFLLENVGDSDRPLDPERTGALSGEDFSVLASLSRYVNDAWALGADMSAYVERLRADLSFKTEQSPSYLTEYQGAVALHRQVVAGDVETDQAWSSLLFAEFDGEQLETTRIGRARRLVFSELITHQIPMSEAFKGFGLWNYRGYFGGSYTAPESYRRGTP